ncbi:MAG: hypothetical protein RRZ84_05810 [Romboutsia sp.]
MDRLKPYYKMLNKYMFSIAFLVYAIIIFIDGTTFIMDIVANTYKVVDGNYIFFVKGTATLGFISIIYGVLMGYKDFNTAMNIRADRASYLKCAFLVIVVSNLIFTVFSVLMVPIWEFILSLITGNNCFIANEVSLYSLSSYLLEISKDNSGTDIFTTNSHLMNNSMYIKNILETFLSLLMVSSIGMCIGALIYRLKKLTSVILFIGIPVIGVITLVKEAAFNEEAFVEKFINGYLIDILNFLMNYNNLIILQIAIIATCTLGTILLLRKAPIREYANDLI